MLTAPYGKRASLRNPNQIAEGLKLAQPELVSQNTEITKNPWCFSLPILLSIV
jgi:hypothetical protein